jgi:hypothetical protein
VWEVSVRSAAVADTNISSFPSFFLFVVMELLIALWVSLTVNMSL